MRLRGFDGLRALAALLIVVLHVTSSTGAALHGHFSVYFARLDAGVAIFFVISGFLLYRPFVAAHLGAGTEVGVRRFYGRRFLRIYPAYWIALTAVIFVFRDAHIHGVAQYVAQYSLMQIYTPKLLAGIVPAWSLSVEVSFYLLLPGYAWVLGRFRRLSAEFAGVACVFVGALVARGVLGTVSSTDTYRLKWLPFMADWFALGLLLAVLRVAYETGLGGRAVKAVVDFVDRAPTVLVLVSLASFAVVAHIGLPTNFAAGTVPQDVTRQILYGVFAAALVAVAALRVQRDGAVRAFLDLRPLVALGIISYGIFLWHDAFINKLEPWRHTTLALLVVVLALTIPVAAASWHFVEKPLLTRRRSGDTPRLTRRG